MQSSPSPSAYLLPIKLQPSNVRPLAFRILSKKHGLNLNTDALSVLTDAISLNFGVEWKGLPSQNFLEEIAKIWKLEDRGLFIDADGLKQILNDMKKDKNEPSKAHKSDTIVDEIKQVELVNVEEEEEEIINWQDYCKVILPNQQPQSIFDRHKKQFTIIHKPLNQESIFTNLHENLPAKINSLSNQYHLILDRLSRNENFQKVPNFSFSSININPDIINEITPIKNVLGRDRQRFLLFGYLSKNPINGSYILEDSTDYIELNLKQATKAPGLFYCEGMYLLIDGIYSASGGSLNQHQGYIGGCLYVSNIGHPPGERRDKEWEAYGNLDFLGIHRQMAPITGEKTTKISRKLKKKLVNCERSLNHKLVIVGSELHLDQPMIMKALKKFFNKLELSIIEDGLEPLALVLIGSFTSIPLSSTNSSITNVTNSEIYKSNIDNLSKLLSNYPNIIQNIKKLILIPGKNDPWQSTFSLGSSCINYLPQIGVPRVFTNRLEKILPKGVLELGWNPTRINYLSQEIVIIKDDFMNKFKRNDIIFDSDLEFEKQQLEKELDPNKIKNLAQTKTNGHLPSKIKQARKLVKTLLDQGNLQPFSKNLKLINSQYDFCLRVEPLPNVLIMLDSTFDNFELSYNGCRVINIISGITNKKLTYIEYQPGSKLVEFKEIYL
ncbi:unnamed protein product [Candida verbasci]|uniref:DNA polymerase epsilon subunit B n=1 Tax=Candida verbasci TaxID=1227364 RepID=A0A9W4XBK2_9ASCO|nr:unnamed protein product [Candida verbasci]